MLTKHLKNVSQLQENIYNVCDKVDGGSKCWSSIWKYDKECFEFFNQVFENSEMYIEKLFTMYSKNINLVFKKCW